MVDLEQYERELETVLEDFSVSRKEGQELRRLLDAADLDARERSLIVDRIFRVVERRSAGLDPATLDPLRRLIKIVLGATADKARGPLIAEAHFSPGDACRKRIINLLDQARRSAEVCVFTITDNRISEAILRAHDRGVAVRIITDDEKTADRGSDVRSFREAGIAVLTDRAPSHMHHKFAIIDSWIVVTGSYNWTRAAATENLDNIVVLSRHDVVDRFRTEFESLWASLAER